MPKVPVSEYNDPKEQSDMRTLKSLERLFGLNLSRTDPPISVGGFTGQYPGQREIGRAEQTGLGYGDPGGVLFGERKNKYGSDPPPLSEATIGEAAEAYPRVPEGKKFGPETSTALPTFQKGWLASRKSAVAQLGFDWSKTTYSDQPGRQLGIESNKEGMSALSGYFNPNQGNMWFNVDSPSALVHESMHHGINMLREQGLLPKELGEMSLRTKEGFHQDELIVRALMRHHFKDVETALAGGTPNPQINEAVSKISKKQIEAVEKAAADYIAKKRPMGPR